METLRPGEALGIGILGSLAVLNLLLWYVGTF